MSLRESGDPLDRLVAALDAFERIGPERVQRALTRTGNDLERETFDRSRTPEGTPWAPLKRGPSKRRPGRRPLVKTGALRSWASHGVITGSRTVWSASRIGDFHQQGTYRMAARRFLPTVRLPLVWGLRLAHAADLALPVP